MRRIIGLGETVYDIIFRHDQPERAVPGGSAFNAIITLGRMMRRVDSDARAQVSMITETGDDHIGRLTLQFMADNGVCIDRVTVNPGTKSHVSLAFLDDDNNAQYTFYKDHAHAHLTLDTASLLSSFTADDILLFGSFFAINPVIRQEVTLPLLQAAHDAGAVLYYDINFRRSHIADIPATIGNIEENMRLSTVVRGSAEDFGYLYGTTDAREVYVRHIRQHCPFFICTDGAAPTHLFVPNTANPGSFLEVQVPVTPLSDVVSTIGAGDNFNAGFLYALTLTGLDKSDLVTPDMGCGSSLLHIVDVAQRFSAHVCQRLENYVEASFLP